MALAFWKKWFSQPPAPVVPAAPPAELQILFDAPRLDGNRLSGSWHGRAAVLVWETADSPTGPALQLACQSDLWCRRIQSVTTMLDPQLFESYTTGDERIDDDWIVQSNPPYAFRKEQTEGCDALFELLQQDSGLHATHGWLIFHPGRETPWTRAKVEDFFQKMTRVVDTAERELKIVPS